MIIKRRLAAMMILPAIVSFFTSGCSRGYLRLNAIEQIREMPALPGTAPVYVYYHSRFRGTRHERWTPYNPSARGQRYIFGEVFQGGQMVTRMTDTCLDNIESIEDENRLLSRLYNMKTVNWSLYLPDISYLRLNSDSMLEDPRHILVARGSVSHSGKPFVELLVREARRLGANVVLIDEEFEEWGRVTGVRYSRNPSSLKDRSNFDMAESKAPSRYHPQHDNYYKVTRTGTDVVGHNTRHRYLRFEELLSLRSGGK